LISVPQVQLDGAQTASREVSFDEFYVGEPLQRNVGRREDGSRV
jgi:hypothetical protein